MWGEGRPYIHWRVSCCPRLFTKAIGEEKDNLVRCKGYAVNWALGIRSNVGSA